MVIVINPLMTLLIAVVISIIMLIVMKIVKPIMREEWLRYNKSVSKAYKWLLQAIQGIKELKVAGREAFFESLLLISTGNDRRNVISFLSKSLSSHAV